MKASQESVKRSFRRRYLVTGSNKGIGYHIAAKIALYHCHIQSPAVVYLGCRNAALARDAMSALRSDVRRTAGEAADAIEFKFVRVDLSDPPTALAARDEVLREERGLDVLVNNAGMAYKGDAFDVEVARNTVGVNFYGTLAVMDAFLPAMERTGSRPRCVNVCSMAGKLGRYPPHMKQRFVGAVRDRDQDQLKRLVEDFIADVETDTYAQKGWPRQTYGISKAAEIASTFVAAEEYGHGENPIFVAACCPGWCRTDMAGPRAPKSAEEGADTPFWLACENSSVVGAMHKRFVQNRQELAWGE